MKCISSEEEKKYQYPMVKASKVGLVILFTTPFDGTVLAPGITFWKVGEIMKDMDPTQFRPITGSVTLTNE